MKNLTLIFLLAFTVNNLHAQFLGRIADRAKDKIANRIEDKVTNLIAEEIARAAMKPIDNAIDDMMRERYVQDSINGKTDVDYGAFVNAMLQPVNLPDSYTFDMTLLCEVKDYDGDKNEMEMMLTKDGSAIGIVQIENDKRTLMVFDTKNNLMAVYNEEEKKVQGLPSVLSIAGAMNKANTDEEFEMTIKKSSKTKKVLGYKCNQYKIEDEKTKTKAYAAEDFPITWKDSFGPFLKQMLPTTQKDQMPEGFVLLSESKTKKKNKKSKFEVINIDETAAVINNAEYTQETYQTQD